jgi:glycosyltransferase involved in cell wall biosynthesis
VNRLGVESVDFASREVELSQPVRVLSVATLSEKKGLRYLIEAVATLVERGVAVHCTIVGSGPLRHELEQAAAAFGLLDQIEFHPYMRNDELDELYRAADIFALPAVVTPNGDRDGLPVVLMEAAAAGCVCISTPVSGIPELIDDGVSGLLVPERDAVALARAIEQIVADPELRTRLREGAWTILRERYDLPRNVAELARVFLDQAAEPAFPSTSK